jgi:hypothetical protein
MINFDNLDTMRKYIALQFSTKTLVAKKIIKYSKCYCPNSQDVPTHILALSYENGSWWIYESHLKGCKALGIPSGVRRYKADKWLVAEMNNLNEFKAYPLDLDLDKLGGYVGYSYGIGDIKELMKAGLFHKNGKQKDRKGYICSEYIALCYNPICEYYSLPAHCITPAHFKDYVDTHNIESVGE